MSYPSDVPAPDARAPRPGEAIARFMERRGHRVLDALGTYWWRRGRYLYMSLPRQRSLALDPLEVAGVLRARHLAGLRYPTLDGQGTAEGLFACRTEGYTLARLTRTRRQEVVKGLAHAQLRWLDPDELLAQGLALNLQTMERHGYFNPEYGEPARWRRFVAAVQACPEVSAAGAFLNGRLSAYVVCCRDDGWLHTYLKMVRTEDLRNHAASALDVWLFCEAAKDPTLEGVTSGGLRGSEHLCRYKQSIGYELLPQTFVTQLHPALGVLANRWSVQATRAMASALPKVRRLHTLASAVAAARASVSVPRVRREAAGAEERRSPA